MNILVTGGARYVGGIVAEELVKQGYRVVALDNLKQGHKEAGKVRIRYEEQSGIP